MRKFLKNSILEIFQTMYEAHVSIKKMIDKKDFENVQVLLEDCQNTAVQIGTSIESSEGEGFVTVGYLEEYCEAVYEVATSISDEYSGNKAQKTLDKKLIKAENSVKNDVKVRLEIVFCPYKASMWDSLESVWKAADEDPDCDAYVVPIPYYDRNPDYSFGEFHYEGGDYPDYVPITHYEAYNFEARRPDVIYIHNPYDEYNNVTSVDPRFYSHELKKYTDCLVYIPYYLAYGSIGEGQRMTSVYNSADYIVIQNESYRKFFHKNIPDLKFLPLGSPKFDKIINTCKNKPILKPEWKIAEGKKVFFYNTTIAEMLCNPEAFLKKMVYVFNTFIQYGQDVCLLWRPHPLLESTIKSMCPQFLDAYKEIKNSFISHNVGIYDDNPDLNYSIALSDVYLGDASSSVASSFAAVGKPLFILSFFINKTRDKNDNLIYKNVQYICPSEGNTTNNIGTYALLENSLFYSESEKFSYSFVTELSEYFRYNQKIIYSDDKAYICPISAKDIIVLSEDKIEKRIAIIPQNELPYNYFISSVTDGRNIYLIPDKYHGVVIFNIKTEGITIITDGIDEFNHCNYRRSEKGFCFYKETLYITSSDKNKIWTYNTITNKVSVIHLDISVSKGFSFAAADNNCIWLVSHIGFSVVKWFPETGKIDIISEFPTDMVCYDFYFGNNDRVYPFSSIFVADKFVYLTPGAGNKFIKIDKETGKTSEWANAICMKENISCYHLCYKNNWFISDSTSGKGYFISSSNNALYKVNTDDGTISEVSVSYDEEYYQKCLSGFLYNSGYAKYACFEDVFTDLEDLIKDNITINKHNSKDQIKYFSAISNNLDGSCGVKIHKRILSDALKHK